MLTVSLGVALALGIRLGTQSAIESMENNSLQQGLENWSDVYQAETPEAALTLTDLASRFEGELFTSVDASLTSDHLATKREQSSAFSLLVTAAIAGRRLFSADKPERRRDSILGTKLPPRFNPEHAS